jgi:hypothetical protein
LNKILDIFSELLEEFTAVATIIDHDEVAVRLLFGKVQKVIDKPGLYWNLPLIHKVMRGSGAIETLTSGPIMSSGIVVEAAIAYRINNPITALMEYGDLDERLAIEIQQVLADDPKISDGDLGLKLRASGTRFGVTIRKAFVVSRGSPRLYHVSGINN